MSLKLKYPDGRSLFKHPENREEFERLYKRMIQCREINDIAGVYTCAMQLIPVIPIEE